MIRLVQAAFFADEHGLEHVTAAFPIRARMPFMATWITCLRMTLRESFAVRVQVITGQANRLADAAWFKKGYPLRGGIPGTPLTGKPWWFTVAWVLNVKLKSA